MLIKGSFHQEDIDFINIYAPIIIYKMKLQKEKINILITRVGDFKGYMLGHKVNYESIKEY